MVALIGYSPGKAVASFVVDHRGRVEQCVCIERLPEVVAVAVEEARRYGQSVSEAEKASATQSSTEVRGGDRTPAAFGRSASRCTVRAYARSTCRRQRHSVKDAISATGKWGRDG